MKVSYQDIPRIMYLYYHIENLIKIKNSPKMLQNYLKYGSIEELEQSINEDILELEAIGVCMVKGYE